MDIICLGEMLIDMLPLGISEKGLPVYEFNPGGAPANVAAGAAALGLKVGLISKVGHDTTGDLLLKLIGDQGIDTSLVFRDSDHMTAMTIVHLDSNGDRSFSFFADSPADMHLSVSDFPDETELDCRIFHFGARSLICPESRKATLAAVDLARKKHALISFDPNIRPSLWKDDRQARKDILAGIEMADLIKLSAEEMKAAYPDTDPEIVLKELHSNGKETILTDGANGVWFCKGEQVHHMPSFLVQTVDTTGAGDSFWAAYLFCRIRIPDLPVSETIRFASASGALTTLKRGAMTAMPDRGAIERFIAENI